MILRSRIVLPVTSPPIENGAVVMQEGRIVAVGKAGDILTAHSGKVRDLGDVLLMPGLINAHCHLDYTNMAGHVPWTGRFMDWLLAITALKKQWTPDQYVSSIRHGLEQLQRTGTTTVVNIECFPELVEQVGPLALRVWWCPELIDLVWTPESAEMLRRAEAFLSGRTEGGLSPHAPFTVSAALYRLAARQARERGWLLTTHVAESREEDEMFRWTRGAMYDRFRQGGRDMSDCGQAGVIGLLDECGVWGRNCLAAHVNILTGEEAGRLAEHQVSVAHCPGTHRFFEREPAPFDLWRRAGLNVCLGTDSRASNAALDMFAEMRALAESRPDLRPEAIVRMATANAARALNREGKLGTLSPDAIADLIALPVQDAAASPWEMAVFAETPVRLMMVGGKVVRDEIV